MIKEGTYQWEIVPQKTDEGEMSVVLGEASTGTKQAAIQARITDDGPFKGMVRTWIGFFTEDTIDSTLEQLRNAGFTGDDLAEFCFQKPEGTFAGRVVHEKDNREGGKVRDRLRFINRQGGGGFKMEGKYDEGKRRLFAAAFNDRLKGLGGGAKPAAPNGTTKKVAPVNI